MMLVDTSVWIDHLRHGEAELTAALQVGQVDMHPFVVGELACGNLQARAEVLGLLQALPQLQVATDKEVLFFMDAHALMGRGIGYVDMHLLAATRLGAHLLWTRDKRLHAIAAELGLAHTEKKH
ncbi:MAG: VapC toxin family PIN domain ribonuclease [Acidovorax sp. 17-64-282]|nr:MAG: VapC toxin family PIN domain ribonuclease [Acidovorax sp. 35-64-16]OYY84935.1 MAG: VapC toxin family PIN domain ribonuclease [Acidovorax sp. 28-64-14]OYZ43104.1 MAG: VapC toxin family PIN domain ribonuclease [Acidovorax sp. 16-64-162]OYZ71078.1 MAG: VapC toxin family PIN domain ribonuclease [Acidovorax sp. 24-64-9]OZA55639.1 MAG: VapC toxin family PIN domain ribonuclease [Acidovorax sp. 17-64-282]OZA69524.1 MAG: VapC toxin family PIN domain ribonuclease [Acidovorax sp. 39-64-12]RDD945